MAAARCSEPDRFVIGSGNPFAQRAQFQIVPIKRNHPGEGTARVWRAALPDRPYGASRSAPVQTAPARLVRPAQTAPARTAPARTFRLAGTIRQFVASALTSPEAIKHQRRRDLRRPAWEPATATAAHPPPGASPPPDEPPPEAPRGRPRSRLLTRSFRLAGTIRQFVASALTSPEGIKHQRRRDLRRPAWDTPPRPQ